MRFLKASFELMKDTYTEWVEDDVPMVAAALAYYTAFSIAPLVIIVVAITGFVANQDHVQAQIIEQIEMTIGEDTANIVSDLIENLSKPGQGIISSILSIGALLLGALGLFNNLQTALDRIWNVDHVEREGGIKAFFREKLLSFGMVLVIGFLLLVSLILSTMLSFLDDYLLERLPTAAVILRLLSIFLSFGMTTLLFMFIYKFLPHAHIQWRDVWIGAAVTSILFTIGRTALGLYLANSAPASVYGAAGAFVLILLWVYYSAQILLFGAEFTQVFARRSGSGIIPDRVVDPQNKKLTAEAV